MGPMVWGLVQLPSRDREYSVYAKEAYYRGPAVRIRRFTYRVDGFVSVRASYRGGELLTPPPSLLRGSIGAELLNLEPGKHPGGDSGRPGKNLPASRVRRGLSHRNICQKFRGCREACLRPRRYS